ncbi:MAG: leucine-rich repeat domain-containing protein, partial [Planctomycetota bacterium]
MARLTPFPQPELVDMNHLFFVRSTCVAFLLLIVCSPCLAQSIFPDKALEEAVRKEVFAKRYNKEPITKDDVRNISQVHAKGKEIKDLTGLEHCVAVQEIDLENNNIKDVSQLAGLKLLQSINLAGNEIE